MRKLEERPGTRLNKPDMRGSGAISRLSTKYIGTSQVPVFWDFLPVFPRPAPFALMRGLDAPGSRIPHGLMQYRSQTLLTASNSPHQNCSIRG